MNRDDVHKLYIKIAKFYIANLQASIHAGKYLEERGVNYSWAIENGIGYASDSWDSVVKSLSKDEVNLAVDSGLIGFSTKSNRHFDLFRDRIMFPILDNDGYLVAFGGRYIGSDDDQAKYINTRDTKWFSKSELLYNLSRQAANDQAEIVVSEGYMDVISARHSGIDNFTAVMGTAFTERHAQEVIRHGIKSVTFAFDGDAAGHGAAEKTLPAISTLRDSGVNVNYAFLPSGMDPDDVIQGQGPDAMHAILSKSVKPEAFVASNAIRSIRNSEGSIDLTVAAVCQALKSCVDNHLDAPLSLSLINDSSAEFNRGMVGAMVEQGFPALDIESKGRIDTHEQDNWQHAKIPT